MLLFVLCCDDATYRYYCIIHGHPFASSREFRRSCITVGLDGGLRETSWPFSSLFKPAKPTGHYIYRPVVTICTTSLTFNNSTFCPHSVFMRFVCISEQTAIISLYNINWLVFIIEMKCIYCAVRTGSLYIILRSAHTAIFMCFVWISEQTAIISLYSIN